MKHSHFSKGLVVFSIAIGLALLIVSSAFAGEPTGATPADALMVPKGAQTIAPNSTVWFYFDYAVASSNAGFGARGAPSSRTTTSAKVNVTLDADGSGALQFAVYTPTQAQEWSSDPATTPVGRGTPYTDTAYESVIHDLYWSGAFNTSGRYFVAVTNTNSTAASFRLTVAGETVTLYPAPKATPTPTLCVPFKVTPAPTGTFEGKVVFETATGGEIYTVNGDGTNLTLVSRGIDPAWSPDGEHITFARWDNDAPGVYIADADGKNERLIFGAPRIRSPRWSPDGKYIAFTQDKTLDETKPVWKLGVVEVATGKLLEPECARLCYAPSWSSDSMMLAFIEPGIGIWGTKIAGGPAWRMLGPTGTYWDSSKNAALPILYMPLAQNAEWSPDGTRIVYAQQAHDRWEVQVVHAEGSPPTALTHPDPIQYYLLGTAVHNVAPTWSPDGAQVLFLSDRNGKWEFFIADADGGNVRQVLRNVTDQVTIKFGYDNERVMDWSKRVGE